MSRTTDAIRRHHARLVQELAEKVEAAAAGQPGSAAALTAFLQQELLPHAAGEEHALYPAVEPLIKSHGRATATMEVDHEFIRDWVRRIAAAPDAAQAAALGRELAAVLRLHTAKEERVYLPLIEAHLSEPAQEALLADIHAPAPAAAAPEELDLRQVPPAQRHPQIFAAFDALPAGGSFVLVNDHDPRPLHYQFAAEREGGFTWEYLEAGPAVWRVRIGKVG
ncbi:MAG: DUF2249 domain-containing protein [Thermaerobacter sp.]|nr:DUF2249 domain-containing protein [Thermaerobacter sp.]